MLMGHAHHAIYFASLEHWQSYPEWARHRRDEIIGRITSEFHPPDYEYDLGRAGVVPSSKPIRRAPSTPTTLHAQMLVVVLLLALGAAMTWLVYEGLMTGDTWLPIKRATLCRTVSRFDEPILFWFSTGIYAAIGLGAVGLVGWGVAMTRRK